jgi:peptide/nickel transport system permease protein
MRSLLLHLLVHVLKRFGQFVLVVFIGINLTFLITHVSPIDPVEASVSAMTAFSSSQPEAVELMRKSLKELYGLHGGLFDQYIVFWKRILVADFGPSLSVFPTPVSTLIARALPWTVGLLLVATVLSWVCGNFIGGLAGYYRKNRFLKFAGVIFMALNPIPYYIVAFILLILFGYLWPILPLTGAYEMNMQPSFRPDFILSLILHSILPILSLVLVGIGGWFLGMRALVSNIVTEDYVVYAELGGVDRTKILTSYVMRNALMPQLTALAIVLGSIFNGAIITEFVYGYPGLGRLLVTGVERGDYSLVLGVTTVSIITVSAAVFLIDLLYPLLDPRIQSS